MMETWKPYEASSVLERLHGYEKSTRKNLLIPDAPNKESPKSTPSRPSLGGKIGEIFKLMFRQIQSSTLIACIYTYNLYDVII